MHLYFFVNKKLKNNFSIIMENNLANDAVVYYNIFL